MKYVKSTGYYGMEYVTVYMKVERTDPKYGDLIHADTLRKAEKGVSAELINRRVPIRGIELRFLRKSLGLSLRSLAEVLGLTHTAIAKWENASKKRLEPINEAAIRSLFAQLLKVSISGWFNELKGTEKAPQKIEVRAA